MNKGGRLLNLVWDFFNKVTKNDIIKAKYEKSLVKLSNKAARLIIQQIYI